MNEDDSIRVSRGTLTVLVVTLVLSLMAVAFLLGRQSAVPLPPVAVADVPPATVPLRTQEAPTRRELPTGPPPAEPPAPAAQPVPEPVPAPATAPPGPASLPVAPPEPRAPERRTVRPAPPPAAPSAPAAPERRPAPEPPGQSAAVREYLAQVEGITAGTEQLGDPNEFATTLLQETMSGETTGIDNLLAQVDASRKKLAAIAPPPTCREHHKLLKEQMAASHSLLQKFKKAMVTGDTGALTALAGQGRTMQAQAARLQKLTEKLQGS